MVNENDVREALKQAYKSAIHYDNMEYRVCITDDDEVCIDEYVEGDVIQRVGHYTLKTYCMWPSVLDYLGPEGTGSEEDLEWLYDEFVYNILGSDLREAMEAINWMAKEEDE